MSYLQKLKDASSIYEFAYLLGFEPKKLAYLLFKEAPSQKYKEFSIPKKSGGVRVINAPQKGLKLAQKRLANILNHCLQEIEAKQNPARKPLSHGFRRKIKTSSGEYLSLGIHTNAKRHNSRRYVVNFDLADFFPAFNFGRVRGYFMNNDDFKLPASTATLIAQVACYENQLPQGSPCSPIITNLITHILDVRLAQLAKKHGCTYSRYADDITFSTNQKSMPEQIATPSEKPNEWRAGDKLETIINNAGFKINHRKSRVQFRLSRQMVTGLTVNKKVNIKSEYYRTARSMCHSLFNNGNYFLPASEKTTSLNQLEGILSHIFFIKSFSQTLEEKEKIKEKIDKARGSKRPKLNGITELYSRFLYFKYFVAPECPLILCEGKTDVIYLKAAIKQLSEKGVYKFPANVSFFPFTRRVSEVMRIHDGTPALKNFIEHYEESTTFKFKPHSKPVIVLLDNDSEATSVVKLLEGKFNKQGIKYDRSTTFIYPVTSNLYVVLLPLAAGTKENKIEDFFHSSVTSTILDGKSFCAKNRNGFNNSIHYSKQVLATKVVRPNQSNILFNNFIGILDLINKTIAQHP